MRAALYYAPPDGTPLARLAANWLGRDAVTGEATREPDPRLDPLVAEPARYGFHATMKAPFRLAENRKLAGLDESLAAFCAARGAAMIERLALARIGRFFALVPGGPHPDLAALADEAVRAFEPFRAPLDEAEIARRAPERLTPRQRALLGEWGYPHVFDEFRFHMTLTGPVPDGDAAAIEAQLAERFASVVGRPLAVDSLALFVEPEPGAPFRLHSRHPLASDR